MVRGSRGRSVKDDFSRCEPAEGNTAGSHSVSLAWARAWRARPAGRDTLVSAFVQAGRGIGRNGGPLAPAPLGWRLGHSRLAPWTLGLALRARRCRPDRALVTRRRRSLVGFRGWRLGNSGLAPELYDVALIGLLLRGGVGRWLVFGAGALDTRGSRRAIRCRPDRALVARRSRSLVGFRGRRPELYDVALMGLLVGGRRHSGLAARAIRCRPDRACRKILHGVAFGRLLQVVGPENCSPI